MGDTRAGEQRRSSTPHQQSPHRLHNSCLSRNLEMASRDTITISSSEEEDDVKIVLVTKRPNRKRQKFSCSAHTQAGPESKDESSRGATHTIFGSSAVAKGPGRARSADLPSSSFEPLPLLERPMSAPLDHKRAIHVPTSLQHGLLDSSFSGLDARPSTPIRQSSNHLSCPASSAPQEAYPTPKTISSPSCRRRHFEDLTSNSYVASSSGQSALGAGAGQKDSAVVKGNRPATPEFVHARGLDNPFDITTRTKFSNSGLGGPCSTSRKSGKSTAAAPGHLSEVSVKPLPQAKFPSSIQSAGGRSHKPNTKHVVEGCDNNPSDRPKKRKLHSLDAEPTVPQRPIRNRILWSTPAYQEPNNDHSTPSPLDSTTELAANSNSIRHSMSTVSQESQLQNPRRTWTCKMYADLAQQLQESFSFADFARKYSRPEHEVFDLFSAVVHLPLLQKSSTGVSRGSQQGHQSVKTYRTLFKETKNALAKEGGKEGKEPKKTTLSVRSSAGNQGSRNEVVKTPSKTLLATAITIDNQVDDCSNAV